MHETYSLQWVSLDLGIFDASDIIAVRSAFFAKTSILNAARPEF